MTDNKAHSEIGASSAKRWMTCPGSVRMNAGRKSKSSVYAEEGTSAHALAEYCLRNSIGNASGKKAQACEFWSQERADAVQVYLNTIAADYEKGDEVKIEERFRLDHVDDGAFGTNDFSIYKPEKRKLTIYDYKHGEGVPVDVTDNPQLWYYAVGAMHRLHNRGVNEIELVVVQPRCRHKDGPVRRQVISPVDLIDWEVDLKRAIEATRQPDAPLVPGEHCRFCPAVPVCPAHQQQAKDAAQAAFGNVNVADMSPKELGDWLKRIATLRIFIKRLDEYAFERAMAGEPPVGHKLVEKRAARKIADPEGVVRFFRKLGFKPDEFYEAPCLKSPAQLDKLLQKDERGDLAKFVEKKSGGLTLAPDTDPREAVSPSEEARRAFEDATED